MKIIKHIPKNMNGLDEIANLVPNDAPQGFLLKRLLLSVIQEVGLHSQIPRQ